MRIVSFQRKSEVWGRYVVQSGAEIIDMALVEMSQRSQESLTQNTLELKSRLATLVRQQVRAVRTAAAKAVQLANELAVEQEKIRLEALKKEAKTRAKDSRTAEPGLISRFVIIARSARNARNWLLEWERFSGFPVDTTDSTGPPCGQYRRCKCVKEYEDGNHRAPGTYGWQVD